MGIEHIMGLPDNYQTNGQAEQKIRELNTALRNVINLRQTNWLTSLQVVAAYSNTCHSNTINTYSYKAVHGRDYPLLDTYRTYPSTVPVSDNYFNRH